ncbi:MAG: T9SS type A sorting domain-containing protein, partial [candidate division Zixibacteria bacterium]
LTIFNNKLVVGGAFEIAGGLVANNIAYWDGLNWSILGSGTNGWVRSLSILDNNLYASGHFTSAGDNPASYVASWDGSSWSSLGAGTNANILRTTIYNNELLVCGFFTVAGTDSIKYVARWNGNSWHAFDNGLSINRYMWSFAIATVSDRLFLGGRFVVHGGSRSFDYTLLQWKDSSWSPVLENGLSDWVFKIVQYDNKLIAGGYFNVAGGVQSYRIAAWDGKKWNWMSPYSNYWGLTIITSFTVYENDLIVGGFFDSIGGIAARNIASWDGTTWKAMDTGIIVAAYGMIDYNGDLVVGGGAIGELINQLLVWNGTSWSTLGRGISGRNAMIYDLIEFDGNLVVAGLFDSINGLPIKGIAQWDAHSWSSWGGRGGGHSYSAVYATDIYDGKLVAAGNFDSIGGIAANMIASWDGNKWTSLSSGKHSITNIVAALTVHGGKLVAGGDFDSINEIFFNNIASFDGREWSSLGSGISLSTFSNYPGWGQRVMSLASFNGDLYVSGDFTKAGDKLSYFFAKWTKPYSVSQPEQINRVVLPEQLQLEQNYPNPFNPTTTIEFSLTQQSLVTLEIYNVLGQKVATLLDEVRPVGKNVVIWDGRSADGSQAASGIYFYKLTVGDNIETKKMLLLR